MKILPVVQYVKQQSESVPCSTCNAKLRFKSVKYNDCILRNGGNLTVDSICKRCDKGVTIIMKINPVKEEYIG